MRNSELRNKMLLFLLRCSSLFNFNRMSNMLTYSFLSCQTLIRIYLPSYSSRICVFPFILLLSAYNRSTFALVFHKQLFLYAPNFFIAWYSFIMHPICNSVKFGVGNYFALQFKNIRTYWNQLSCRARTLERGKIIITKRVIILNIHRF